MKPPDAIGLLRIIYQKRTVTQAGLADELGLSRSYVNSVVQGLKAGDLVHEVGFEDSRSSGRRRVLLEVNAELAHLVGVDIGTANLRMVRTDLLGRKLSTQTYPSDLAKGRRNLLERLNDEIRRMREQDSQIKAIGVAQSGVIDRATGKLLSWPNVREWRNVPLKALYEKEHHLPAFVDDSVRAMAIAEFHFGQGRGETNFVHVAVGMGIGAAVFSGAALHYGADGFAGELGHVTVEERGEICSCGNHGCLEVCASGRAMIARARSSLPKATDSVLYHMVEGALDRIRVETIVEAARNGDRLSNSILKDAGQHLGTALADVVNLLNPRKIILGGAVPREAGTLIMEPIMTTLRERALPQATRNLEVTISHLPDDAAAIGAAILAADGLMMYDTSLRDLVDGRSGLASPEVTQR